MSKPTEPEERQAAWQQPPPKHLPGSVWLPNVGLGSLSPEFADYFADNLATLTGGDAARPLVFYCDANCWLGYNAAKRAVREFGYSNVYWYPDGVEGWQEAGLELVEIPPEPMPKVESAGH